MHERKIMESGRQEHMKQFFASSAKVINVTLKMESVPQFQESSTLDTNAEQK